MPSPSTVGRQFASEGSDSTRSLPANGSGQPTRLRGSFELGCAPGTSERPGAVASRGSGGVHSRQSCRVLHSPDDLSRDRSLERPAQCRRRHLVPNSRLFVQSQASAFNGAGRFGRRNTGRPHSVHFCSSSTDARSALDFAYHDVSIAFDEFVKEAGDRPIILAGHSQGALHLMRLLREKVAGKPIAKQLVAAYVVGWPIDSLTDLPSLGLPACQMPTQTRCILSWMSFRDPANPSLILDQWKRTRGLNGGKRRPEGYSLRKSDNRYPERHRAAARQSRNSRSARQSSFSEVSKLAWSALIATKACCSSMGPFRRSVLTSCRATIITSTTMPYSGPQSGEIQNGGWPHGIADHDHQAFEFASALPSGGKLLGLDVGTRTIGVAICDAGWHFAGPSETVRRTKFTKDLASLRRIIEQEQALGLVIGLPLSMDGSDSPRTQSVRAFARNLAPLELRSFSGTSAGRPRPLSGR